MLETRVTRMLGIQFPILQGGLLWLARAELTAAVSNAGGLGILSSFTFENKEDLVREIRKTRKLTDKPFAVNIPIAPTLRPFSMDSLIGTILDEGVRIVETAGRSPESFIDRLKREGVIVLHKCGSVRNAQHAQRIGCDAVIIDGYECGGHPGEDDITSLVLIPIARDAIDIPLIAAGGFADGRGLVAALALGAEAILMGTRFVATKESPLHSKIKEWLMQSSERDTMIVQRSLRNSARVLRNSVATKVAEMEQQGASLEELAPLISGKMEREVFDTGDRERGLIHCGQSVGLVKDIPTVKELIDRIVNEADGVIQNLNTQDYFQPRATA
jgi:nitronate monooxygenase